MEDVGLSTDAFRPIERCRSCGKSELFPVLDLGVQPLANRLVALDEPAPEPRYPLATVACRTCALLQLSGTVDPRLLFDDYSYLSSMSRSFVEAAEALAARTIDVCELDSRALVIEVGSNDGYLLTHYRERGVPALGIEPSRDIAAVAQARGVETEVAYFDAALAAELRSSRGPARVMHANNVMAHVPDINSFVAGVATLLADDGVALIESPYVLDLVDNVEFDTIYHEHVFYFSLTAMEHLVRRHGLVVAHVEHLPVHGGTIRYHLRRHPVVPTRAVDNTLAAERVRAVTGPDCYAGLSEQVRRIRDELPEALAARRDRGERLAAYGAAAKGTVLLNACAITTELVDFVADRNPRKHGLAMPGVGIPIEPAEALFERQPAATLLLAWNLLDEILEEQRAYRDAGGTFIIPGPQVEVVSP